MKFKVKSGSHREGKKVFVPGDIVDTDRDLEKAFKNKFERIIEGAKTEKKKDEPRSIRRSTGGSPNIQV